MEEKNKPGYVKKGQLLIASPKIMEPFFSRSVIFILESEPEKGHIGLILNHPMGITMSDIFPLMESGLNPQIFNGGPVEMTRLFMLHAKGEVFAGSHEIVPGIYVGGDLKDVARYLEEEIYSDEIRFFLGYSGWGAGQLEAEIANGNWVVKDIKDSGSLLSGLGSPYWQREVYGLGEQYQSWMVMPEATQVN